MPEFLLHAKFHDSLNDPGYISKKWTTLSCLDAIPAGKVMEKLGQHAQIASDVCKVAFGSALQQPEQASTIDSVTHTPPQSVRDKGQSAPPRDSDPASPVSQQSHRQPQQSIQQSPHGSALQQPEQAATIDSVTHSPTQSARDKGPSAPPRDSDPASPVSRQSPRQPQQSAQQSAHAEGPSLFEQRAPEIVPPKGRINLWDVPYGQTWQPTEYCETASSEV